MNKISNNPLETMIAMVFNKPTLIPADSAYINSTLAHASQMGELTLEQKQTMFAECINMNAYGAYRPESKPYAQQDGVAVIPVRGMLLNRFGYAFEWATGYNYIRSALVAAANDTSIDSILLDVNSFGGEASGCFETVEVIREVNAVKPVVAYVDSVAFSAGFAIASAAGRVYCTPTGRVGSIGVVSMHVSHERQLIDSGIDVTFIQAGARKTDMSPYKAMSDEAKVAMQAEIDSLYNMFTSTVATNRKIDVDTVVKTEAALYNAENAIALNLIDGVLQPTQLQTIFESETDEDEQMTITAASPNPVADEPTVDKNALIVAERARISAIMGAANGRVELASHLAYNTNMSADEAIAALNAAAKDAVSAAQASTASPLDIAMASTETPKITADSPADAESLNVVAIAKLLNNNTGV